MGKRRVNFQRCWLPVSRIGLHRRGVERVNCGPKLLDLGEKGVYSSYTCRVPGGDYEGYVDAHVRRLEALRRAGIVERIDADQWRIPDDLVSRAAAHDAGRDSQASVRVLSPVDLNKQIGSDGATWLDRGAEAYRQGDYELALQCYKKAADCGNSQAMCNLGYIYAFGRVGEADQEKAFYYFT